MSSFTIEVHDRSPLPVNVEAGVSDGMALALAVQFVGSMVRTLAAPTLALVESLTIQTAEFGGRLVVEVNRTVQGARVASRIQMSEATSALVNSAMDRAERNGYRPEVQERLMDSLWDILDSEFERLNEKWRP